MASITEQLVTEYVGVDRVTPIIERVADANQRLHDIIERVEKAVHSAASKEAADFHRVEKAMERASSAAKSLRDHLRLADIGSGIANVWNGIASAIGAAVEKAAEFGKLSILEAGKIERLQGTFAGLHAGITYGVDIKTGQETPYSPIEVGADSMDWLKGFAGSAMGQMDDLAEAATKLDASGLYMERWLPTISNLAGAFGATKEKIEGLADALGKLAGGSSGEALERLRDFGITRSSLEAVGLKFDGGGQLLSKVDDALVAIERIADERFGKISEFMAGTFEQTFSNVGDSWNALLDTFGQTFLPLAKRVLDTVKRIMDYVTDEGAITNIGDGLAAIFDNIIGDKIPRIMFYITAGLERLPDLITSGLKTLESVGAWLDGIIVKIWNFVGRVATDIYNLFHNGIGEAIHKIEIMIGKIFASLANINFLELLAGAKSETAKLVDTAVDFMAPKNKEPDIVFKPIEKSTDIIGRIFDGTAAGKFLADVEARTNQLQSGFVNEQRMKAMEAGGGTDYQKEKYLYPLFNELYTPAQEKAEKAAKQAEKAAKVDKTDVRELLFGGGDRAKSGFSIVDVTQNRRSRTEPSGKISVEVKAARSTDKLKAAVQEAVAEMLTESLPDILRYTGAIR